jgi:uncharacterized protein YggE
MDESSSTQHESAPTVHTLAHSSRLHGTVVLVLVLLAAFLAAQTFKSVKEIGYVGGGIAPTNAISVSGTGEVFAVPDTAEFTFTVMEKGDTVSAVQDAATKKANDALDALKQSGVQEKDIKTVAYELQPTYEWQPVTCVRFPCDRKQVQTGFSLTQSVRVKVHDLDKAGELLQTVTSKGVQSVSSLTFTIADEEAVRADARKQAIDQARTKADTLASDLGVSLVRIVGFSENGNYPIMYASDAMKAAPAAMGVAESAPVPSIPAGQNRITSDVTITYEIR